VKNDWGRELVIWANDKIQKRTFTEIEDLLMKIKKCGEDLHDFNVSVERGEDLIMPFTRLRMHVQELAYSFSEIFKKYATPNEFDAVNTDILNFKSYLFTEEIGRYLADSLSKGRGELVNIVSKIQDFLSYLKIVIDSVSKDVENTIPQKFREHALKNAGLIPKFKEMKELAKKVGEE